MNNLHFGRMGEEVSSEITKRLEFLPNLPKSDSIWGDFDILNSKESSQATLARVKQLVEATERSEGIYLGMKMVVSPNQYRLPLQVFKTNPDELDLPFNEMVTAISGPLTKSEAIADAYILEIAAVAHDILEGHLEVIKPDSSLVFEEMAQRFGGQKRFVPLGLFTLHDYIARMVHYRHVKDDFPGLDMSEENAEDLALVVGLGIIPLAKAFRQDGYRIGENFQQTIDKFYLGNQTLFIPFAGILGGHPQNIEDWQMVGLGLYTGVRLFRKIEAEFSRPITGSGILGISFPSSIGEKYDILPGKK